MFKLAIMEIFFKMDKLKLCKIVKRNNGAGVDNMNEINKVIKKEKLMVY